MLGPAACRGSYGFAPGGRLQSTSNPRVYAAGDAAGVGPPLTPVSSHDGKVVAANLLGGPAREPDYRGVPSVAFTVPPIASVGMDEAAAHRSGRRFRVNAASTPDWFSARRLAECIYGHKVLIDEDSRAGKVRPSPVCRPSSRARRFRRSGS